jgi:hypothetical protein
MFRQTKEIKENSKSKGKLLRFLSRIKEDSVLFFGGKSVDKNKSTSQFVPITLEQSSLERRRRSIRSFVGKTFTLASVSIILGTVALQAGGSIIGVSADYTTAYAENKQGQKSSALERSIDQLKIAAGEADGSLSSGAKGLSPAEVKTVGFFISNWYSPFTTRVSIGGNTVGDAQTDIQEILKTHAGLADDPAGELAKMVVNTGSKTAEPLYLAKSDDGGNTWTSLNLKATYFEVLFGSVGLWSKSVLTSDDEVSLKKRYEYNAEKGTILGLVRESKAKDTDLKRQEIVYEWNPDADGTPTVSQAVFYTNFASVDASKTWGSSVVTLDGSDTKIVDLLKSKDRYLAEKLNAYLNGFEYEERGALPANMKTKNQGSLKPFYDASIYSASMYTDGFGNLISETGSDQRGAYVVIPASQNPMMYAKKSTSTTSASSSDKKETDKSKEKETDKSKESSPKVADVNTKMSEIYNNSDTGIGRQIPLNNLNALALNKGKGYLTVDKDKATLGGSVDRKLRFYSAIANNSVVAGKEGSDTSGWGWSIDFYNFQDLGAVLQSALNTQWLVRNGNESATLTTDGSIFHSGSNLSGYEFGSSYSDIRSGTTDYALPQGYLAGFFPVFGDSKTMFDLTKNVPGADAWVSMNAKPFSDDSYKFKSNMTVTKPVIDDIISFDDKGFAGGNDKFKKLGDNGTLLVGKAQDIPLNSSRLTSDGYWVGQGTKGGLVDTAGSAPKDDSDKKYAINLFASTVLVRANPLNKDIPYVINLDNSSVIDEDTLKAASEGDEEDLDHVLKNMAYFMLNPTKGREYKQRWSKTFMNQTLLSSLQDMVGANTASSYSGTTRYLELTGFATIPKMNEIKFTDYLYSKFSSWGVTILIVASFLMLIFLFVGQIRVVPAILSVLAFGYLLYSPPKMIDASTHLSNQINSYFFKDKFTFWVMATHQNYSDSVAQLQKSAEAGNYDNYTALLVKLQGGWGGSENEGETDVFEWQQSLGASVKVRWMAPKKDGYIQQVKRDLKQVTSSSADSSASDKKPSE